ncbi:MAG: hypothetical protein M3N29_03670 [Chloroflexota bacterium]|nr:hypothetical protein [Chloroflexota bacterium]
MRKRALLITIAGVVFVALLTGGAYIATIAGYGHRYQTAYVINESDLAVVVAVDWAPPLLVPAGERGGLPSTPYGSLSQVTILSRECETIGSTEYSAENILITVDRHRRVEVEHNADLSLQPTGKWFAEANECARPTPPYLFELFVRNETHSAWIIRTDFSGVYADVRIEAGSAGIAARWAGDHGVDMEILDVNCNQVTSFYGRERVLILSEIPGLEGRVAPAESEAGWANAPGISPTAECGGRLLP